MVLGLRPPRRIVSKQPPTNPKNLVRTNRKRVGTRFDWIDDWICTGKRVLVYHTNCMLPVGASDWIRIGLHVGVFVVWHLERVQFA